MLQNGRAALDPFYTVGQQLTAAVGEERSDDKASHWLQRLGFEDPRRVMALYPHELSGGMAQRVMLGLVLAQEPEVLLLDEITTGLDVSLQASVLDLLGRLYREVGFSAVLVTHDLGVARSLSSQVVIMRHGRVEQAATTDDLFARRVSLTAYAERLVDHGHASPVSRLEPVRAPEDAEAADFEEEPTDPAMRLVHAERIEKRFGGAAWTAAPAREVLSDITLTVASGECVALVGESGSGKTTLTRILSGLTRPDSGRIVWAGRKLGELSAAEAARLRRHRTVLFQNPYTSLNPAMTTRTAMAEALSHDLGLKWRTAYEQALERLEVVGLQHRADQPLGRLSGGERRRVGLLCALQAPGELLVLDEPTAGLDAEHRAGVQRLIRSARNLQPHRTILLVSHDVGFVVGTADRVVVLYRGRVVEEAAASDFLDPDRAHHPYTQLLWDASRYVAGAASSLGLTPGHLDDLSDETRSFPVGGAPAEISHGCPFRPRCPVHQADSGRWDECRTTVPRLRGAAGRRRIACHGVQDVDLDR